MHDRDKIIKAIETHLSTDISVGCDDCTYNNDGWCTTRLLADILALLKEQEPKPVRIDEDSVHCPSCGNELFTYPRQKFCDECGQEITWNG